MTREIHSLAPPDVLKFSRINMDLTQYTPRDDTIETRLRHVLGEELIPVSRWFDIWKHIHHWFPRWDRLSFNMQAQQQTNWCWAATSTSVSYFYDAGSTWTQCSVANAQVGRSDCCGTGASGPCNIYGYLDDALTRTGNFDHRDNSAATFQQVKTQINSGRPVGMRTAWSGGGAHFLALIGYLDDTTDYVAVDDPIYGKSDVSWSTILSSYQGSGSWTHTYYTQP